MNDSLTDMFPLEDYPEKNTIYLQDDDLYEKSKPKTLPTSATEITITIRNSEKNQRNKHLIYENYFLNDQDPVIKSLIAQALQEFNAEPDAIRIRANLVVL